MSNRRINVPIIIAALIVLACPACCAAAPFAIAACQDGFTIEAFDSGPSPWWNIGMVTLFVVAALCCAAYLRISKEKVR